MTTMIELRTNQHLTVSDFAVSVGITPQMVNLIENGDVNPGDDVIKKVKEVYGEDIEPAAGAEARGREKIAEKKPVARRTKKTDKAKKITTIKQLRASLNLSQAAFAKAVGFGLSTIGNYECGFKKPSQKFLAKIKEMYGVDIVE